MTMISIMPDFGDAWAWYRKDVSRGGIGPNIASHLYWGGPGEIPQGLIKEFQGWQVKFERQRLEPVDWPSFHEQGIKLTQALRKHLHEDIRLFYHKPCEDPLYCALTWECPDWLVEIMPSGEARPITDHQEIIALGWYDSGDPPRGDDLITRVLIIDLNYKDGWGWFSRQGQGGFGLNVGIDAVWNGPGDIPQELLVRFGRWQKEYQDDFDKQSFDLAGSRATGLELARKIRRHIPGDIPLFYWEPPEGVVYNPDDHRKQVELMVDGTIKICCA